jgi:hypothetical protein
LATAGKTALEKAARMVLTVARRFALACAIAGAVVLAVRCGGKVSTQDPTPEPPGYHPLLPSLFSTFDTSAVNDAARGFQGAAFDGRYVYLAPSFNGDDDGIVVRYDTAASFTSNASWSTFDATTVNPRAKGFYGAAFDGRYLYLVPHKDSITGDFDGVVVRYDTHAIFGDGASWSTFDTTTVDPNARGFIGATFDGRYVYLVPSSFTIATRYDTQASFTNAASWSTFDAASVGSDASVSSGAGGYYGAAFDGRYVYLAPSGTVVTRYDTTAAFADGASWSTFDTYYLFAGSTGFAGAAFDGRYLYLVPLSNFEGFFDGVVTRYDTTGSFTDMTAWSTFDTMKVDARARGFDDAAFDGRYVYFVPVINGDYDGVVTRYDTTAAFENIASWSTFDTTTMNGDAKGFSSAVFDGQYVYFVPYIGGSDSIVTRFDARTPPVMPALPAWHGSFY